MIETRLMITEKQKAESEKLLDMLPASKNYRKVRSHLKKILIDNPHPLLYLTLAKLEFQRKEWDRAKETVEELLKRDRDDLEGQLLYAQILEATGQIEHALTRYKALVNEQSEYAPAYREYARCLLEQGGVEEVEHGLIRCLELNPRDALSHILLAEVYALSSRMGQAALHLELALTYMEKDARFHRQCARLLMRMGRGSEAVEHLRLAVMEDPHDKRLRTQFRQAIKQYEERIAVGPMLRIWLRRVWPS
ncbi:lipopolysaccharide assembly protein LapB [Mechercharimyces sp. CAU 1602]|uniref:tetratricopeptide repeat protein n=1 Tax=Mechercharimyces sp. CAU 1602 TaxID=2973933 RepID=UPI0021629DCB|nr:tetratricopeptide repeat protein [Mechercharimyces sp. CAU 1602]MCS1350083.1 tetratricopeptide repeat protein [Mechercharimyces sp. CAU 1602]